MKSSDYYNPHENHDKEPLHNKGGDRDDSSLDGLNGDGDDSSLDDLNEDGDDSSLDDLNEDGDDSQYSLYDFFGNSIRIIPTCSRSHSPSPTMRLLAINEINDMNHFNFGEDWVGSGDIPSF